jgi:tetratricopeptide (TPR) repeat protein
MGFFRCCIVFLCVLSHFSYVLAASENGDIVAPASLYPSYCSQGRFREVVAERNFHAAVSILDQWLQKSSGPEASAFLLVEKAKVLYADQQHSEALDVFVSALQQVPLHSSPEISSEEKKAFDALFPLYESSIQSPEGSLQLLEESKRVLQQHPEFFSVEHYIAACLANRGQFIEFFDRFFHVFQTRPDCFLRYKTIGVLHLRLFESSSNEAVRELHRQEAVACLKEAFTRKMEDSTVLVKLAFILPPKEKAELLKTVVADLIHLQTPIRRSDCFFLIQLAIDVGERDIAKQMIEKAHSWYQYSRALHELTCQLRALEK